MCAHLQVEEPGVQEGKSEGRQKDQTGDEGEKKLEPEHVGLDGERDFYSPTHFSPVYLYLSVLLLLWLFVLGQVEIAGSSE